MTSTINNPTISKDTKFTLYTYTTPMDKQGTIILTEYAANKLEKMIESNALIEMRVVDKCSFSLDELLTKGLIINGDSDLIDSLQITIPDKSYTDEKPKIVGKYFHGSRKKLFSGVDVDFMYDPSSSDDEKEVDNDKNITNAPRIVRIFDDTNDEPYDESYDNINYDNINIEEYDNTNDMPNLECLINASII
jgi:hypothetical protein